MIYRNGAEFRAAQEKRVLLFGMSGLGKTHLSNLLRDAGGWFHYSVDYRIGTRYMGEYIADNFKREAMKVPLLRELLMTDSVYIASNITFDNLAPLSTYLGKPGNPAQGGVPFAEYCTRQAQHREAEVAALHDTLRFIDRARDIYGYSNFVCDSGGSICEVVDATDPADPVMTALSSQLLMVWIKGGEAHRDARARPHAPPPRRGRPPRRGARRSQTSGGRTGSPASPLRALPGRDPRSRSTSAGVHPPATADRSDAGCRPTSARPRPGAGPC